MNNDIEDFKLVQKSLDGGAYQSKRFKLFVVSSKSKESDEKIWHHVSMTRLDKKLPTYAQMKLVKERFIGDDKTAIQVFPKAANHVNLHPTCLHLWCCEDDIIPDFSRGTGSI